MTLKLFYYYYYYEEEGPSLVSKVNTGGILAEECAAESWDCFPKFLAASLAACQSWYLCLIVITPLCADHYLAACLQFPSHFQKEIIKAPILRTEVCSVALGCCPPLRVLRWEVPCPKNWGVIDPHQPGKTSPLLWLLLFSQHLLSASKSEIWVSFSCSMDNSLPALFPPNPAPPTCFLSHPSLFPIHQPDHCQPFFSQALNHQSP